MAMTRISVEKKTATDRYHARNYLTNLLFEGEVRKACDTALKLWQHGTISEEDYRFIASRRQDRRSAVSSPAQISSRQRMVE